MTTQPKKPATPADVAVALLRNEAVLTGNNCRVTCRNNGEVSVIAYLPSGKGCDRKYYHAAFNRDTARLTASRDMPRAACELLASLGFVFDVRAQLVSAHAYYVDARHRASGVSSVGGFAWITKSGPLFQVHASSSLDDVPPAAIAEFKDGVQQ